MLENVLKATWTKKTLCTLIETSLCNEVLEPFANDIAIGQLTHTRSTASELQTAVLDGSLHLGLALAILPTLDASDACSDTDRKPQTQMRVPASLGAYLGWDIGQGMPIWAAVGDISLQGKEAAKSTYRLTSSSCGGVVATMQELVAKPMTASTLMVPTSHSNSQLHADLSYVIEWKTADVANFYKASLHTRKISANLGSHLHWRQDSKGIEKAKILPLHLKPPRCGCLTSTIAKSLTYLQQLLKKQDQKPLHVQLLLPTISGYNDKINSHDSLVCGATQGLMKSAAHEYSEIKWQAIQHNSYKSNNQTAMANLHDMEADAYGASFSEGTKLTPRLLQTRPHDFNILPLKGSAFISGGFGEIGTLASAWAAESMIAHIHVIGRSGHVKMDHKQLFTKIPYITFSRCDIAREEETKNVIASAHAMVGYDLRHIWHAGGLLHDGTLMMQTASSLRYVSAPKISGAINVTANATCLALDDCVIFSSTAALLGPPGQANYAAANAQLNNWVDHKSKRGAHRFFMAARMQESTIEKEWYEICIVRDYYFCHKFGDIIVSMLSYLIMTFLNCF